MNKLFVDCLADDAESIIKELVEQDFVKFANDTGDDYAVGRINYSQLVVETTMTEIELEKYLSAKNYKSIDAVFA